MSAQDRTLDQYHELMQINAVSHLIRAGRQAGLFDGLDQGQRTLEQLCEALSLPLRATALLLDGLVAIGIIEKYDDDYALSQAARLLCAYDQDLGDHRWQQIFSCFQNDTALSATVDQDYFDRVAATQWIHTPAAMQAAEILNLGSTDDDGQLRILDIGGGSAVWSCAMAHRAPTAAITLVDHDGALKAAAATAESIGLTDRITLVEGDPQQGDFPDGPFDVVLLAQRLHCLGEEAADELLQQAVLATRSSGTVVVIDSFRGPAKPNLAESVEALQLELGTQAGRMRTLQEAQQMLGRNGLQQVQFTFLAASRASLGLAVGVKPEA